MPYSSRNTFRTAPFYREYLIILGFLLLYLLFPTSNSSLDAWGYACSVKYGSELFTPHHLLHNAFLHLIFTWKRLNFPVTDALETCKQINSLFAGATLIVFYRILKFLLSDQKEIIGWLIVAGSAFGFMRFATENETYIIPLFISILGSYYLLRENYFFSGSLLALACLFHQVHFLWWLACAISILWIGPIRKLPAFLLPAIIVPVVYSLVIVVYNNQQLSLVSFFTFIFSDYLNGSAEVGIDIKKALLLTPISFIRTFTQLHGNTISLIREFPFLIVLPLLLLISCYLFLKNLRFKTLTITGFHIAMGLAFILHFAFAGYSAGNAEFMVMLPMLLILAIAPKINFKPNHLIALGLSILFWNVCVGLLPNRFFDMKGSRKLLVHMNTHAASAYVLDDYWDIYNQYLYKYNKTPQNALSFEELASCKPCFQKALNEKLKNNQQVFTDCVKGDKVLDRSYLMDRSPNEKFWDAYMLLPSDTLEGKWNRTVIYEVALR